MIVTMDSTPCVWLITNNDNTFVIVRQSLENLTSEIVMNIAQYNGLMFVLKSMEKQLTYGGRNAEAGQQQPLGCRNDSK